MFTNCSLLTFNELGGAYYLGNSANPHIILVKATSTSITSCNIAETTKFIASGAFYDCRSLTSVTIPEGLVGIGNSAFMNCTSLTSITMPYSLRSIGESAFEGCTALTRFMHITYTTNFAASIGARAFYGCRNLLCVTSSVSSIGAGAFGDCEKLNDFRTNVNLTEIGYKAFAGCKSLSSIFYKGSKAQWKKLILDKEWRKESAIRSIECEGGTIKFLFS